MPNSQALSENKKASRIVAFIDYLDIGAIFAMFYNTSLLNFLEVTGRFFMFPIAAAGSIIQAALAWRQAKLDGGAKSSIVKASVETAAAFIITFSVIAALAFASVFSMIAPAIFAATLGAKACFQTASAFYYANKSASDLKEQQKYNALIKENIVSAVISALACVAVLTVMVLGKIVLAGLGIAAGVAGATYAAYNAYQAAATQKSPNNNSTNANRLTAGKSAEKNNELSKNAQITKTVGQHDTQNNTPTHSPSNSSNARRFSLSNQSTSRPANETEVPEPAASASASYQA